MAATLFHVLCRAELLRSCHDLNQAIDLAQQWTGSHWVDCAIWQGNELVAAVQAGGTVTMLTGPTWVPTSTVDADVLLIDQD